MKPPLSFFSSIAHAEVSLGRNLLKYSLSSSPHGLAWDVGIYISYRKDQFHQKLCLSRSGRQVRRRRLRRELRARVRRRVRRVGRVAERAARAHPAGQARLPRLRALLHRCVSTADHMYLYGE